MICKIQERIPPSAPINKQSVSNITPQGARVRIREAHLAYCVGIPLNQHKDGCAYFFALFKGVNVHIHAHHIPIFTHLKHFLKFFEKTRLL